MFGPFSFGVGFCLGLADIGGGSPPRNKSSCGDFCLVSADWWNLHGTSREPLKSLPKASRGSAAFGCWFAFFLAGAVGRE